MKKKGFILVVIGILILLCGIVIMRLDESDSKSNITLQEKSEFKLPEQINIVNLKLTKQSNYYSIDFQIQNKQNKEFDFDKYNIYLLDRNNNLLGQYEGSSYLVFQSTKVANFGFQVCTDISSLDKVVIMLKTEKLKYNEDISSKLKYICDLKIEPIDPSDLEILTK